MITKIDKQLEAYDAKVGGSLKMIDVHEGKISVADLEKALQVIKHRPEQENVSTILDKLDSDHDGFVVLDEVVALTQENGQSPCDCVFHALPVASLTALTLCATGLGIVVEDSALELLDQGAVIKDAGGQTSADSRA
jgi:hypothetical protein